MVIIGYIVLGDRTSHGGTVVSGDPRFSIDGQPVARAGDRVACPRCQVEAVILAGRFPSFSASGQPYAFDQDATSCGARLMSRHNNHVGYAVEETPASAAGAAAVGNDDAVVRAAPRLQEHFILHGDGGAPLAQVPYTLSTETGQVIAGVTDAAGRTAVVWTAAPEKLVITIDAHAIPDDDRYHVGAAGYPLL